MPLFFIVGGYANAASWEAALRAGRRYHAWLAGRLRRLVVPVVALLVAWTVFALAARPIGVPAEMVEIGSELAFTPTWFLGVYIMVVLVAPVTHAAWRRFGMASFWGLVGGAVLIDAAGFAGEVGWLRWANYAFVWLSIHHLGYLWRDGRLGGPGRALACRFRRADPPRDSGLIPGEHDHRARTGALEQPSPDTGPAVARDGARRPGAGPGSSRETLARARAAVDGDRPHKQRHHDPLSMACHGDGAGRRSCVLARRLRLGAGAREPASARWWALRPPWILTLLVVLAVFVAIFGRFEQLGRTKAGAAPPAWQSVASAAAVCTELAALAMAGIEAPGGLGIRFGMLLVTVARAAFVAGPRPRWCAA